MKLYLGYNGNNTQSIKNFNLYKIYLKNKNIDVNINEINLDNIESYFDIKYINIKNYNLCLSYLLTINNINEKCIMYIDVNYNFIKNIKNIKKKYIDNKKLFYYCCNEKFNIKFLIIHPNNWKVKNIDIANFHNLDYDDLYKIIIKDNESFIIKIRNEDIFNDDEESIKIKNSITDNLNILEKKKLGYLKKHNILYVTSFNKKLYSEYGKKFLNTFNFEGDLILFSEEDMNFVKNELDIKYNLFIGNLLDVDKGFLNFCKRNKKRNIKDAKKGFRFNAIRFSYKVFSLINAYKYFNDRKYDLMIWLDGDIIFKKQLKSNYVINKLSSNDTLLSYLGRKNGRCYSECGFLIFNLNHKYIKKFLYQIKDCYLKDEIYELDEWHDSYIWDYFRIKFQIMYKIKNFNITNRFECKQNVNHIVNESPLKDYLDHLKGDIRKEIKTSQNEKLYNKMKKKRDSLDPNKQNNQELNNFKTEKLFNIIRRQIKQKINKLEKK